LISSAVAHEIPLRTTSSGFLSGEVSLDGLEKPLNFIVDTGASVSVVSHRLAEFESITAHLQPVMMGALSRERINAAVLDMDPVNETAGFIQNGILGGNFLRHFRVSFDFGRGVMRLEPLEQTARTVSMKN
jgi:hypothetical protein